MFLPKKKNKFKKRLVLLVILIIVLGWFYYLYSINTPISENQAVLQFVVEPGWGVIRISQELVSVGLIRNAYLFQFYAGINGLSRRLQDGAYFLSPNQNLKEITRILSRGAGLTKELTLTFIEGWNNQEVADYLNKQGLISSQDFMTAISNKADWWDEYEVLASRPTARDLEGYLFPDTYRVFRDATITDVVRKMLDNLENKLTPELRQEIAKQRKTIHEILTMASILEKEVSSDGDRKIVADIFYKRLELGMPLQADSTVNYVTGKTDVRSSAADLEIDSPYNTYKYQGLPPGPISNPGMASVLAAIYPRSNPYFYFLTTPDGQVIYNKTYEGHVAAKAKYYP